MSAFQPVTSVAVTLDNFEMMAPKIAGVISSTALIGLDIETAQPRAHQGIKDFNQGKKLAFDIKRTDICGMSLYGDGFPEAWYLNVGHADVGGRIPWDRIENLLNVKPTTSKWVVHNAAFELVMLAESVGWVMKDFICSMQMAVSAYGPDEYNAEVFQDRDLGDMAIFLPEIQRTCAEMTDSNAVQELLQKIISKESKAAHSYNGYVKQMNYGYGLKQAVQAFFGYQMKTYEQTLGGRTHMGELTTAEVASYGCDDAIWCLRLFHRLLAFMMETNPAVVGTYFQQELPMIEAFADIQRVGVRINHLAVAKKQLELRVEFADTVKLLKAAVKSLLPFPEEPHASLMKREEWYAKNHKSYRDRITTWANSENNPDPFLQCIQLSGSIPKAWADERGVKVSKQLNISHYMVSRTLIYDLFRHEKPFIEKGKVQSDAEARGRLKDIVTKQGKTTQAEILTQLGMMATIQQAEGLYLSPYLKLVDPDSGRLHPVQNSLLTTRRMAMSMPNVTQLAKRGESVYVRGFYLADHDDHVIVSIDWSQIELVLFGEFSQDPLLCKCYSKIPYDDVHVIATAACLGVSDAEIERLRLGNPDVSPHLLINPKGEPLALEKAFSYWRTAVGKGSNFEFIYSGLLYNLGVTLGWSKEKMFAVTENYATKFASAAEWRREIISAVQTYGAVTLPDNHRRVRYEATPMWALGMRNKWRRHGTPQIMWFAEQVIRRTQTRAGNQTVNATIQGTSATLTKRSMTGIRGAFKARGWVDRDARLMFSVHDEIVASVHRDKVTDYIRMARGIMMDHPEIVKTLLIDCTPSIGLTFQPWHPKSAPTGQIELFEAPAIPCVPAEYVKGRLPEDLWAGVVDHLFAQ